MLQLKLLIILTAGLGTAPAVAPAVDSRPKDVPVLIVDGRNDQPLADVTVVWSTPPEQETVDGPSKWSILSALAPDASEEWERHVLSTEAGRATTDSAGQVRVPLNAEEYSMVAYNDTHWGRAFIRDHPEDDVWTIRIYPDVDVQVQTLDDSGAPLGGVSVALRSTRRTLSTDQVQAVSDTRGIATLRHAGYVVEREMARARRYGWDTLPAWSVALDLCTSTEVSRELDPARLTADPISLTLPPISEVMVRVLDTDGNPIETECPVALCPASEFGKRKPGWAEDLTVYFPTGVETRPAPAGIARFPQVPPGQELVAVARRNHASASVSVTFKGPATAGASTSIDVQLGHDGPTLTGRILLADGSPAKLKAFSVEVHEAVPDEMTEKERAWARYPWPKQRGLVRTDADGRFSIDLEGGAIPTRPVLVFERHRNRPDTSGVAIDISNRRSGAIDLGDLVEGLAPVLAAGQARDETGAPVGDARVFVSVDKGSSRFYATTDERGQFVIRTLVPHPGVSLSASKAGYGDSNAHDLPTGIDDVEMELAHAGDVLLQVSLPDGLSHRDVSVGVSMKDWDGRWGSVAPNCTSGPEEDGTQRFTDLPPGVYHVRVRVPRDYVVTTTPLEVEIVAGQEATFGPIQIVKKDD